VQMGGGDTGQLSRLRADKPLLQHSQQEAMWGLLQIYMQ
jgi:hypothetical protein